MGSIRLLSTAALPFLLLQLGCMPRGLESPATAAASSATLEKRPGNAAASPPASSEVETVVPYPFDHCAVIQKPFGTQPAKYRRVYQGHEVLLCCVPCVRAFDANPDPFMPRIIAAAETAANSE